MWSRPIQKSEIAQKTAHNTYQIDGLPPTPICNPGRAAIEAVLNPADTKELYFVADGTGGHVFAETLKDHNANVQKWRATERDIKAKPAPAPAPDTPTTAAPSTPKTRAVVRTVPPAKTPPARRRSRRTRRPPRPRRSADLTSMRRPSRAASTSVYAFLVPRCALRLELGRSQADTSRCGHWCRRP